MAESHECQVRPRPILKFNVYISTDPIDLLFANYFNKFLMVHW